ncbi:MAG: hypothetical protein K0S97_2013 [Chloroflexota bacterium]|nr:hypothetical protein [Chloroflexota bacterium]
MSPAGSIASGGGTTAVASAGDPRSVGVIGMPSHPASGGPVRGLW